MINFVDVEKSLKAAWVDCYCLSENTGWCMLLDSILQKLGGSLLFQCNYDLKTIGSDRSFAILAVWRELHSKTFLNANEMKEESLEQSFY